MTAKIIVLLSFAGGIYTNGRALLAWRPTRDAVEVVLCVSAVGNECSTLRAGSASYLTRWHPSVVVDIEWQFDDHGVIRVTGIRFREKTRHDSLIPLRRRH